MMLREGSGEPLVLLHGILCTAEVWDEHVVDTAEVQLDVLGLGGPHLAGFSMFDDPGLVPDTIREACR
jgi:hypothetical protein